MSIAPLSCIPILIRSLLCVALLLPIGLLIQSEDLYILHQIADFQEQAGFQEKAKETYSKIIALDKLNHYAYLRRGVIYYVEGNLEAALNDYNSAISLCPGKPAYRGNRGTILCSMKEYELAISDLDFGIEGYPDESGFYYSRIDAYAGLGDKASAAIDCTRLIVMNQNDYRAYEMRSWLNTKLGFPDRAWDDIDKAIEINPKYYPSYTTRAWLFFDKDDYLNALNNFSKAIELNPDNHLLYLARGHMFAKIKNRKEAIADYQQVLKINPKCSTAYESIGTSLYFMNDLDGAFANLNKALELSPASDTAFEWRAAVHARKENFQKAMDDYSKAIELNSQSTNPYHYRGVLLFEQGDLKGSMKDFNKAIQIDGSSTFAYRWRGEINLRQGHTTDAMTDFKTVLNMTPALFNYLECINRAIANFQLKDYPQAKIDLDNALKFHPDGKEAKELKKKLSKVVFESK